METMLTNEIVWKLVLFWKKKIPVEVDWILGFVILLYNFNILYGKIKVGMLGVL